MKKISTIFLMTIIFGILTNNIYAWDASKKWKTGHFIDDFGDITNKGYIYQKRVGLFSNSATSNSHLYAKLLVDQDQNIKIELHEYGPNRPAKYFIGDYHFLGMKNSKGQILKLNGNIFCKWNHSGGLGIICSNAIKVIQFLRKSVGDVTVRIHSKYGSSYSFFISADGFCAAYDKVIKPGVDRRNAIARKARIKKQKEDIKKQKEDIKKQKEDIRSKIRGIEYEIGRTIEFIKMYKNKIKNDPINTMNKITLSAYEKHLINQKNKLAKCQAQMDNLK